jgi:hypothetical protein
VEWQPQISKRLNVDDLHYYWGANRYPS